MVEGMALFRPHKLIIHRAEDVFVPFTVNAEMIARTSRIDHTVILVQIIQVRAAELD